MSSWSATLDAAGIRSKQLRADFTRQRRVVARYRFPQYLAVRLLLPRPATPHLLATTAFMHHTDNLLDQGGSLKERSSAYGRWAEQVREALATERSDHAVLRPVLHTCRTYPNLLRYIENFLDGATTELDFAGFVTEEDYQRYIDAYSLPAFMMVAGVLAPEADEIGYRNACRTYIDGSQRLDFTNDLADDLRAGRLNLPQDLLDRYGVTRDDLVEGRESVGVCSLIAHQLDLACTSLNASRTMVEYLPTAHGGLGRALIGMEEATAEAARGKSTGLLTSSARPAISTAVRLLTREYRQRERR